ncbi:hypothetical protein [Pediococcus pentosaceus]|jgi:hypothetical protein|uniref:hypothetical protein n=1 Tax=Pediococcus pentosaceus TaxID=1255 RepID=UPI0025702B3F|nr:hypothetical protein [Pediococcus pentosaceus]MDN4853890.1 hypothetical protein [Pediococcus pentosaceus]
MKNLTAEINFEINKYIDELLSDKTKTFAQVKNELAQERFLHGIGFESIILEELQNRVTERALDRKISD